MAKKPSPPAPFSWHNVPVEEQEWLKNRTEAVENFGYRIASDIIRIGQILIEVRAKLHRQFIGWLLSETALSKRTAYNYISVAHSFGPYLCNCCTIQPKALYLLAAESTPSGARDHAVEKAQDNQVVTYADAVEFIDAYRPVTVTEKYIARYESLKKANEKEETRRDHEREKAEVVDEKGLAGIGAPVKLLTETVLMFTVSRIVVTEPDEVTFNVTVHEQNGTIRDFTGKSLQGVLERAVGRESEKYCPGCCRKGEGIPRSRFGQNLKLPDLLMSRCSQCEKDRKKPMRAAARVGKVRKRRVPPPQVGARE